jgi:hypothetical protein
MKSMGKLKRTACKYSPASALRLCPVHASELSLSLSGLVNSLWRLELRLSSSSGDGANTSKFEQP